MQQLLIAEIHGLAGRAGELQRLLGELVSAARSEDGCLAFRLLVGDGPGEFVVLSSWRVEDALRSHYGRAPYQRYRAAVGELLARPSDVTLHLVSESVHAIDPNLPEPGLFG